MSEPEIADGFAEAQARLAEVRTRIARAARDCDRDPADVTLVCVSKTFDADSIVPVLEAGERVFGENKVQEAQRKWPALRERYPGVILHLIGPLQSNKAEDAVATFDVIESVDRPKIAAALAKAMNKADRRPKLFVQINTGDESQKAGVLPQDADGFISSCRSEYGLEIAGLMCIPPIDDQASPHFALLAKIAARNGIGCLSMGMSADFELGIQLGATHVRVGSAIFGDRSNKSSSAQRGRGTAEGGGGGGRSSSVDRLMPASTAIDRTTGSLPHHASHGPPPPSSTGED